MTHVDETLRTIPTWVWEPPWLRFRVRGVFTATLIVAPGRLLLRPRYILGFTLFTWSQISYEYPVVVIETLLPLWSFGILIAFDGGLGKAVVPRSSIRAVRSTLEKAGFEVITVRRWGWEAPQAVPASVLGAAVKDVPACVVAGD